MFMSARRIDGVDEMAEQTKTQHDSSICGALPGRGPAFGRKIQGCPRCDELLAGAAPRALSDHRQTQIDAAARRERDAANRETYRRDHLRTCDVCRTGRGVCTAFDW
jgi:hypothetical protein